MYRMLYNDSFLFDPFDETRIVSSASITTNVNAASYLDFTIAATHPLYNTIEQRSGTITLYSDNEKLFQGQITAIDMDMDGNKSVTCSSALDWLKDVQLRPYSTDQAECNEYEFKLDKAPDALDAYFQWLIDQYNARNKDNRYFTINVNQAADLTNRNIVYFASTSPRSVADAIEEDILKTFGGYLVLRYEDDQLILDLYSDIHEMNEQVIDYGENILDISRSESTDNQYTAVYPIGATPQYTAEQQKYHDEKDAYDEMMKRRDETEKAAINKLKKEEEAEQKRITGMGRGPAKSKAQAALQRRKQQRQAREQKFSDETKRLQDAQKIKDDKNNADKTKPNPITIKSLNNGGYPGDLDIFKEGDVVYSMSYVARYGYKEFVYSENDVHDKNELLTLAVAKLKTLMAPVLTIDVRAVDQALYNPKHRHLFAGQAVRVRSKAHNVDEFMMVSSIDLDLIDPSQTTATLGVEYDTLTGQQSSFLRNLNSQIVASVDAVDKLGENVKATEITIGKVETVVENTNNKTDLIINTVDDYKWMTDTAWGKADDAQADADKANQGVTDTNIRIDNIKMATDERIDEMQTGISDINTEIDNTKAEVEQAKQTAEQIRQDAQAGIEEAKQQAEDVRTEANTAIDKVKTDLDATEAKAQQAASNASAALGGLSSANTDITNLRTEVDRHTENITNINGEIVGVRDTVSGVAETANSALSVATTNTHAINEQSTRIDTAYSDIETTRTSVSEVKQTADGLKVNLETNYLDKDALGANYASKLELSATSESITSTVSKTYATKAALEGLQNIADAAIETWSGQTVPTASNPPASTWTTNALKKQHSGDIYYDISTGKSYRWGSADGKVYSWSMIADSDITKAIADAAKAQQTADGAKQDVVNLSDNVKATYTSKSDFKQTSDEIKASVNEVASVNETNAKKIAEVSVKADGISAKVAEQAETISGHATTIGQLSVKADGLQTKFEQVSDDLGHVRGSIPGLINPNFTDGDYGWIHNGASFRISTHDASLNGPYLVGENFSENGTYELINKGLLSLTPRHKYRISILMHVSTNILRDNRLSLRFIKTYSPYVDYPNTVAYINTADITNNRFVTYSREITCPDKVTQGYFRLAAITKAGSNSYISVKSVDIVDITEGSAALTKTSELQQSLDGFKQTVTETYTTKSETEDAINGVQIGGTNLSIANGYYNVSGLKNFTYTPADDQYDFDVSAASSGGWGHRMAPKTRCADQRRYPWGKWGTGSFDVYSERECTFVTDINNGLADGSGSGNDHDLRSKAKKILPDGSTQLIGGNGATQTHITIPAQQWVRIGIMCYNGNQSANPNHADIQDYSSIGFLSLGEDFHVKVRKIKFEVGNKPTEWSPCPLDMLDKASAETTYTTKSDFTQTANEIKGTVAEQATTINGHTDSIASLSLTAKKFETDISQTSEQVNGILGRTTKLEQDLGGFKQSVSNTYISKTDADKNLVDAINAMQIGGTNMLLDTQQFGQSNPNNVTSGKLININAATGVGDSNLQNTKYSAGFKWRGIPSSNTRNNADGARYSVFVKKGGTYTLSFESMTTSDFYVYFYGPNGYVKVVKTIVDGKVVPNTSNGDGAAEFKKSDGAWVRHTITWVLGNDGSSLEKYVLFRRKGSSGYVTILAPKLEEGSKATEWSPSPFDTLLGSTIDKTYASKSLVEQTESRITSTVEQNYASKTQLTDEMKKSVRTIEIRGRMDGNYWWKLGRLTMPQQGKDFHIDFTGGRGFNGDTGQNSQLEIHVRSSNGGGKLFAVTVNRLLNADMYQTKAFVIDATHIDLYLKSGAQYSTGTMAYYGQDTDFSGTKEISDISTAEGTELTVREQSLSTKSYVDQTAESVSIGVVQDFKDGKHGDKLTTQSNLTALKDEINTSVSKKYADLSDQIKLANSDNAVGKNFSFESNNFDGWASHDRWTIGTSGAHTGRYYAQNTIPANSNGNQLISTGSIAAEYGHTYKLEYWVKRSRNTQCHGVHRISYKRSGVWEDMPSDVGKTIFLDENGTTNITSGRDYFDVSDNWTKVTTYIIPPSTVTDIRVRIIGNNPGSAETVFAVDDVSLTDYSVAKTINKTMAGISVKADSITQEVRNDYATKDLVNRSIPGLKNPNFDVQKDGDYRITGWSVLGPWAETRLSKSSPVSSSEGGTYFVGKSGTTAGQTLELINQGYISAYPRMKVQISWWMSVDPNVIRDSNFSAGIIANNVVTRNLLNVRDYSNGQWKYMTTTVEVPANVNQFRVRFAVVTTGTSGWLRLDSVSVTDVTEAKVALGKANTAVSTLDEFKRTVSNTYVNNNKLTQVQSEWKHTTDGFAASIKKSEKDISAINGSATVINGAFEAHDTTGWALSNFKNTSVTNGSIYQNSSYRFLGYRSGNNRPTLRNEGTITANKGDFVKVSARILLLNSANTSIEGSMRIGVRNTHSGVLYLGNMTIMAGGWNTVSYNVKITGDGTYSLLMDFPNNIAESTKILVDDVTMANETEAVNADTRINALETRIAMTAKGVRVGKIANGNFVGMSALVNSEGSFDILNGEQVQATLSDSNVGLMRDASTGKYRFQIKPYALNGKNGTNLLSYGQLSLNSMPTVPATTAVDCALPGGQATVNTGSAYVIPWDVRQFQTNGLIISNPATYRTNYYQTVMNGGLLDNKAYQYAVGIVGTSGDAAKSLVFLNPGLYAVQYNTHVLHTTKAYFDYCLRFKAPGASSFVTIAGAPDWRAIEVDDPAGYLQRTSIVAWVYVDAGTQMQLHVRSSVNNQKLSVGNHIHITRMSFGCALMN